MIAISTTVFGTQLWLHSLYGDNRLGAEPQVLQSMGEEVLDVGKAIMVLPEEAHEPQLGEDAEDVVAAFLRDEDAVYAAAEDLDRLGQIGSVWQSDQGVAMLERLDLCQSDRLLFRGALSNARVLVHVLSVRCHEANDDKKIKVQVAVVERGNGTLGLCIRPDENDIRRAEGEMLPSTASACPSVLHSCVAAVT